jgi:hypothetical protein
MSIQEVSPEQLAELLHHYHHALAFDFSSFANSRTEAWAPMPRQEKSRLVAAARFALFQLSSADQQREDSKPYFAKSGEAEWGC